MHLLLSWMSRCCPLWLLELRCSPVVLLLRVPEGEAQAGTLEAGEAVDDPADVQMVLVSAEKEGLLV